MSRKQWWNKKVQLAVKAKESIIKAYLNVGIDKCMEVIRWLRKKLRSRYKGLD